MTLKKFSPKIQVEYQKAQKFIPIPNWIICVQKMLRKQTKNYLNFEFSGFALFPMFHVYNIFWRHFLNLHTCVSTNLETAYGSFQIHHIEYLCIFCHINTFVQTLELNAYMVKNRTLSNIWQKVKNVLQISMNLSLNPRKF